MPPPYLAFEGLVSLDVSRLPRGMPEDLRALPMVDEGYLGVQGFYFGWSRDIVVAAECGIKIIMMSK